MELLYLIFMTIFTISALLFLTYILKETIYIFNPIFFLLNRIQWILYNPLRIFWKNSNSGFSNKTFNLLFYTGIIPIYWITIHIISTPLRLINAIYFNILLSWSINIYDSLAEVINPKLGKIRHIKGFKYLFLWIIGFPIRLFNMIIHNMFLFIEPIIMTGVDIIFPTYTMYHGTTHGSISADITQKGRWLVGDGNYAGTGIYFGMVQKVAEHYSDNSKTIILVRVILMFNRNIATTPNKIRSNIGLGYGGDEISRQLPNFWSSIEHWRKDMGWFEYCIIQPISKKGSFVTTWRARPIALIQDNKLLRIWGGKSINPSFSSISVIIFSWGLLFILFSQN